MNTNDTEGNFKKIEKFFENNITAMQDSANYKANVTRLIHSELEEKKTNQSKYDYLLGKHDEYLEKRIRNKSNITPETYAEILKDIDTYIEIYGKKLNISDNVEAKKNNLIKINWTGQSNTLTHLFRQLKSNVNKDKQPLITNSYDEIAQFFKENFTCFENVTISTIVGQLKKKDPPKKTKTKIELSL